MFHLKRRSLLSLLLLILLAYLATRPARHTTVQPAVCPRRVTGKVSSERPVSTYAQALQQYVAGLIDEDTLIRIADEELYETARASLAQHKRPVLRLNIPWREVHD